MTNGRHPDSGSSVPQQKTVMLQIYHPGDDKPLKFPALVRNLATGVATLEVNNPWTILNWESLKGQEGSLHLLTESGEFTELQGAVNWARYTVTDRENGRLSLGLKLADPNPSAQKLLNDQILHTTEDIKTLWDRWDQARRIPEPAAFSTRGGFVALALLGGFLAVNLVFPSPFKLFGWVLWLSGALVVARQTWHFWRRIRDSR